MAFPRLFTALAFCTSVLAQQNPAALSLTNADYARAEKFMGYNTTPLVFGAAGRPGWMADGRFWYRVTRENGPEFRDCRSRKGRRSEPRLSITPGLRQPCPRLPAVGLKGAGCRSQAIDLSADSKIVSFTVAGKRWKCALDSNPDNFAALPIPASLPTPHSRRTRKEPPSSATTTSGFAT